MITQDDESINDFSTDAASDFPFSLDPEPAATTNKAAAPKLNLVDFCQSADDSQLDSCPNGWPQLSQNALPGWIGDLVAAIVKNSEADPSSVLFHFLTAFGAAIGSDAHVPVCESAHPGRLFTGVVGASSRARKGTSARPILKLMSTCFKLHPQLTPLNTTPGPLSSGEGLVNAVRDPSKETKKDSDEPIHAGVADKRLLVISEELASALSAMRREGNTLSSVLRTFWDSGDVAPLTKTNPIATTGAHVCVVAHITQRELTELLKTTDIWNGMVNRFLWVCARRSKLVDNPVPMEEKVIETFSRRIGTAIEHGRVLREVPLSATAKKAWKQLYPTLSRDEPGIFGVVTARGEAMVLRLSLLFAILDGSSEIKLSHLMSGTAAWQYSCDSARYLFGTSTGNPCAEKILEALKNGPKSQTQINGLFSGHQSSAVIKSVLGELQSSGRLTQSKQGKTTFWQLTNGFDHDSAESAESAE